MHCCRESSMADGDSIRKRAAVNEEDEEDEEEIGPMPAPPPKAKKKKGKFVLEIVIVGITRCLCFNNMIRFTVNCYNMNVNCQFYACFSYRSSQN